MKFRKKPVIIDAVQLRMDTCEEVSDFVGAGKLPDGNPECKFASLQNGKSVGLFIPTLEGVMTAMENDWIIKGVQGEFYPCKPDIFEQTYEAV
jgi:hypothetical protein